MTSHSGAAAPGSTQSANPAVRPCYVCLGEFDFTAGTVVERDDEDPDKVYALNVQALGAIARADRLSRALWKCPGSAPDYPHYLPYPYVDPANAEPILIAIVGDTSAGKSVLLSAIVHEITQNRLSSLGVSAHAIDLNRHNEFRKERIAPLFQQNKLLPNTQRTEDVDFADGFMLHRAGDRAKRPVLFFDLAGADLQQTDARRQRVTSFLNVVDALLFAVDPGRLDVPVNTEETWGPDLTVGATLDRLGHRMNIQDGRLDVVAALALTKSDRLRYEEPLDRWLAPGQPDYVTVDPERIRAESRDVYAYLYAHGGQEMLAPVDRCRRATLHVVSAIGGDQVDGALPFGMRPQGVLHPLISILVMTGALPHGVQIGTR